MHALNTGGTNWQASTVEDMLLPLTADWAEVSASKESKLAYMEKVNRSHVVL